MLGLLFIQRVHSNFWWALVNYFRDKVLYYFAENFSNRQPFLIIGGFGVLGIIG